MVLDEQFLGKWMLIRNVISAVFLATFKNAFGVSHRVQYQENYAGGEILETYAPALPI